MPSPFFNSYDFTNFMARMRNEQIMLDYTDQEYDEMLERRFSQQQRQESANVSIRIAIFCTLFLLAAVLFAIILIATAPAAPQTASENFFAIAKKLG